MSEEKKDVKNMEVKAVEVKAKPAEPVKKVKPKAKKASEPKAKVESKLAITKVFEGKERISMMQFSAAKELMRHMIATKMIKFEQTKHKDGKVSMKAFL